MLAGLWCRWTIRATVPVLLHSLIAYLNKGIFIVAWHKLIKLIEITQIFFFLMFFLLFFSPMEYFRNTISTESRRAIRVFSKQSVDVDSAAVEADSNPAWEGKPLKITTWAKITTFKQSLSNSESSRWRREQWIRREKHAPLINSPVRFRWRGPYKYCEDPAALEGEPPLLLSASQAPSHYLLSLSR